jgi:hypothetical protein
MRVLHGAGVRQPREGIGRGASLGARERAQVGEDRAGLHDRLAHAVPRLIAQGLVVEDQDRADDLAADERGHARRLAIADRAAQRARQQRLRAGSLVMAAPVANRQARPRVGVGQEVHDALVVGRRPRLEPVLRVVALEHDRLGTLHRALDVALEQGVRLVLAARHLHRLGELVPCLRIASGAAAGPLGEDPRSQDEAVGEQQEEHAQRRHLDHRDGLGPALLGAPALVDQRNRARDPRTEAVHDRLALQRCPHRAEARHGGDGWLHAPHSAHLTEKLIVA